MTRFSGVVDLRVSIFIALFSFKSTACMGRLRGLVLNVGSMLPTISFTSKLRFL